MMATRQKFPAAPARRLRFWSAGVRAFGFATVLMTAIMGCGGRSESPAVSENSQTSKPSDTLPASPQQNSSPAPETMQEIPTISLGSGGNAASSGTATSESTGAEVHRRQLLAAMMPLQVMLGTWHGTTQREFGQFKAIDHPEWVWDFQSDRNQPAMVMTSAASPYLRSARLTYLTEKELYQLTVVDADGKTRTLQGNFSEPVEEFQGDDQKMHARYKLELTQSDADESRDQWQVVFNQQDNNRYLQEMGRKRGAGYIRVDTVATQREGTSFAKSDAGYGEKECVISGGLGTIQLTHKGKSYWVCCTGCKAAFEEDPESWIAEYQKKKAAKGS